MAYDIGLATGMSNEEIASSIVHGSGSALHAVKQAEKRRVDVVMLGDSNQQMDGYGFTRGIDEYLSSLYGQYATPIYDDIIPNSNRGFVGQSGSTPTFTDTPQAEHLAMFPKCKTTLQDLTQNVQCLTPFGRHFNTKSALRFWSRWGGFPSGVGEFNLNARYQESPYTTIATGPVVSTNTGDYSYNLSYVDVPEGGATLDLAIGGGLVGNVSVVQPMTYFYTRTEDVLKDSGVSCHTLYASGGQSLYDFAGTIEGYSDSHLTGYFEEVRRLQLAKSQPPLVVVYINSGVNDLNETSQPTQGEYGFDDSASKLGYLDNLSSILNRIEHIWNINGWSLSELHFLCVASHVISSPNDAVLTEYREGLKALSESKHNLTSVDLSELMTYQDGVNGGWYKDPATETVHLTTDGYNAVSQLIFS